MNISPISVMLDTSHFPIGPCTLSKQSESRDNSRQLVTALLSSDLDCGENMDWSTQEFGGMAIRRRRKITWWYNSKWIGAYRWLTMSLCVDLWGLCPPVCFWKSLSFTARLTRVNSQQFESIPNSSPVASILEFCGILMLQCCGPSCDDGKRMLPQYLRKEIAWTSRAYRTW